jgi:hypothetical protein
MDKKHWMNKMNIPKDADVVFYQNPKFFRSNSFRRENLEKSFDNLMKLAGKIKMYTITGIANGRHKHTGKREKVCLVREFL